MNKITAFKTLYDSFLEEFGKRAEELYNLQRLYSKGDNNPYKVSDFTILNDEVCFTMFSHSTGYTEDIRIEHNLLLMSDNDWADYLIIQETLFKDEYAELAKQRYEAKLAKYNKLKQELGL